MATLPKDGSDIKEKTQIFHFKKKKEPAKSLITFINGDSITGNLCTKIFTIKPSYTQKMQIKREDIEKIESNSRTSEIYTPEATFTFTLRDKNTVSGKIIQRKIKVKTVKLGRLKIEVDKIDRIFI